MGFFPLAKLYPGDVRSVCMKSFVLVPPRFVLTPDEAVSLSVGLVDAITGQDVSFITESISCSLGENAIFFRTDVTGEP